MTTETVTDRIALVRENHDALRLALLLGIVAALGAGLLFAQDPLVHDAMHNFRHAAGVTCH